MSNSPRETTALGPPQRSTDAAITFSDQHFKTLFEASPVAITITSVADGIFVDANPTFTRVFGFERAELIGRRSVDLSIWAEPKQRDELVKRLRAGQSIDHEPVALVTKSGNIRSCVVSSKVVTLDSESCLITQIVDMTEELLQRKLAASKEQLRAVFSAAAEGIVVQQRDGSISFANASAERILGLGADELAGRTSHDQRWQAIREDGAPFDGDDHPAEVTLRTGEPQSNTIMGISRPDGTSAWISINSRPLMLDQNGSPSAVVISFADITDHRAAELALKKSEERFRALLANAADITLLLDSVGSVRWASSSAERVLGFEPGAFIGRPNDELAHPEDHRALRRAFVATVRAGGDPHVVTLRFRHADGSYRWIEAIGSNRLGDPAIEAVVVNARDVSDHITLRDRLRQEALQDALTGLPNRAHFLSRLRADLAAARRHEELVGVLFIDLNDFKSINDQFGHAAGDQFLVVAGRQLSTNVRPSDLVARIGGDEFAVVLSRLSDRNEIPVIAERLLGALALPVSVAGAVITLNASIGAAVSETGLEEPEALLAIADELMYRGKMRRMAFDGGFRQESESDSGTGMAAR